MSMLGLWILAAGLPAAAVPPSTIEASVDEYGHRPRTATVRRQTARDPGEQSHDRLSGTNANWQSLGPAGGEVADVARSPTATDVALAATIAGIYRSADGGATWAPVSAVGTLLTHGLEFAADGTAYVATIDSVWKSTDDGINWTQLNLGIGDNDQAVEVAIDPNNTNNVWAGISDDLGAQPINVIRSTDGGINWSSVTPPLAEPLSCFDIAFNPNDSDEVFAVFAGFGGGGEVWFSNDGGTTWFDRSAGLPNRPMNAVDHDGSRVLVGGGQRFGTQNVGLYASNNDGVTWTPLHDGTWPLLVVNDVALDPNDSNILLAATAGSGVHRSTDGGNSWQLAIGGTTDIAVLSVRFAAGSSDAIFLGTSSRGVFQSIDGGAGFEPSTAGISLLEVNSIVANPGVDGELAAAFVGANDGGVYSSIDGGASWSLEPLPPTRFKTVRFAPNGTLYAISDGPSSIAPEGLYRREPNGTWTGLGPDQGGLFETRLDALRFSTNDPDLILAGGSDFGVAGFEATIWRSTDAGQSWTKTYEGLGAAAAVSDIEIVEDGTDNELLASYFFGNPDPGGVLRSIDGGASWLEIATGLPSNLQAASLCAPPGSPNTFYLADRATGSGSGGLHRSDDRGQTWQNTGYIGAALEEVVCDPAQDDVLYIAQVFSGSKVQRSEDAGATFTAFDDGLEGAGAVRSLDITTGGPAPRLLFATHRGSFATSLADHIFADGFESGDTSAWSTTKP